MKYRIRFNTSRGQPNRGSKDHVWRVFDETGKEWICKQVSLNVPCFGKKEAMSEDWNIVCEGQLTADKDTSTVEINPL
jgi:hypothetical protein